MCETMTKCLVLAWMLNIPDSAVWSLGLVSLCKDIELTVIYVLLCRYTYSLAAEEKKLSPFSDSQQSLVANKENNQRPDKEHL